MGSWWRHSFSTVSQDEREQDIVQNGQNPLVSQGVLMVEPIGIEPTTSTMPFPRIVRKNNSITPHP